MSQEIELKLALPSASLAELRRHPMLATAEQVGATEILDNTYFDTPGQELRRDKIAVRLRQAGQRQVQTIKCAAASVGGLSSRPEWETPWNGESFDFSVVTDAKVRERLEKLHPRIAPAFNTRFERTTLRLTPHPGLSVLAMIDHGSIEAAGQSEALCELELELESGEAADLFAIAIELAQTLPLKPDDRSKAQRGYALFSTNKAEARRAASSGVSPGQDAGAAFRTVAFECLSMWVANDAGLGAADPEFVHQARVALRRLRSAFSLFADILEADDVSLWRTRLGELAAALGGSRDADVVLATILVPIIQSRDIKGPEDDLNRLASKVEAACKAAQNTMLEQLSTHNSGLCMLQLAAFLHATSEDSGTPVEQLARDALRRTRRKARLCVEAAEAGDVNELHRLRIVLKRLRYGLEFFVPLWAEKNVQQYGRALAQLQDDLGEINDAATGNRLLAELAGADPGLTAARAYAAGWHAPRIAQLRVRALERARTLLWSRAPWQGERK